MTNEPKSYETSTLEADLKSNIASPRKMVFDQLTEMRSEYFAALERLSKQAYISQWDQMDDIRKVSQMGLAIVEMGKAYSALNAVYCN